MFELPEKFDETQRLLDQATEKQNGTEQRLNYFQYFTEVEEEFVRRRGSHMLISPIDWALIESWKEVGIPLAIVLRGINTAFDGRDARASRFGKVNSILYCQQAVEECYAEYRLARVGEGETSSGESGENKETGGDAPASNARESGSFSQTEILEFIQSLESELGAASEYFVTGADQKIAAGPLVDAIERGRTRLVEIREELSTVSRLDSERIESDLNAIDRMLLDYLRIAFGPERLEELKKEAKAELRGYKTKMDKAIYEQTINNFVTRRLREIGHIPRLSLFYLL